MPNLSADLSESPFFRRNYGGFTKKQKRFYESILPSTSGLHILDPMGGQGYFLSELSRKKQEVWLGDMNPAPLLLASFRDLDLVRERDSLRAYVGDKLRYFKSTPRAPRPRYIDDWIAPSIRDELHEYYELFGLGEFGSLLGEGSIRYADPQTRFAACLPVLSARALICFHETDNATWFKRGGLLRGTSIYEALMHTLDRWFNYASCVAQEVAICSDLAWGSFNVSYMDVEHGVFGESPSPDVIITSPPYANRLDYTRMWAPELEVASVLFNIDIRSIKTRQIGSTVVRERRLCIQEKRKNSQLMYRRPLETFVLTMMERQVHRTTTRSFSTTR